MVAVWPSFAGLVFNAQAVRWQDKQWVLQPGGEYRVWPLTQPLDVEPCSAAFPAGSAHLPDTVVENAQVRRVGASRSRRCSSRYHLSSKVHVRRGAGHRLLLLSSSHWSQSGGLTAGHVKFFRADSDQF